MKLRSGSGLVLWFYLMMTLGYDRLRHGEDLKHEDLLFQDFDPMTFKDPEMQSFFPALIDHYKQLDAEIPKGEPGLIPGSSSRSNKIEIIQIDQFAWLQHQ